MLNEYLQYLRKYTTINISSAKKEFIMKIWITEYNVEQIIKNAGIQLDVYSPDGENRLGDLTVTKTKLVWCAGKTHKKNGIEISWADFIDFMENKK
jgi:hypothetical protein